MLNVRSSSFWETRNFIQKVLSVGLIISAILIIVMLGFEAGAKEIFPFHNAFEWLESDLGGILTTIGFVITIAYVVWCGNNKKQTHREANGDRKSSDHQKRVLEDDAIRKEVSSNISQKTLQQAAEDINTASSEQLPKSKLLLVQLHKEYAKHLLTQPEERRAIMAADALFESARICIDRSDMQACFAEITAAYVNGNCPYYLYVTPESLSSNPNQKMYAEWCHITAMASCEVLQQKSLNTLLKLASDSRYYYAKICQSSDAERFGKFRTPGVVDGTPLAVKRSERCVGAKLKCPRSGQD